MVASSVQLGRDPATSVGRPVTELPGHPFLTFDIRVIKAAWVDHEDGRWLEINLAIWRLLFCSTTGRVWNAADATPDSANVVPFARWRAS